MVLSRVSRSHRKRRVMGHSPCGIGSPQRYILARQPARRLESPSCRVINTLGMSHNSSVPDLDNDRISDDAPSHESTSLDEICDRVRVCNVQSGLSVELRAREKHLWRAQKRRQGSLLLSLQESSQREGSQSLLGTSFRHRPSRMVSFRSLLPLPLSRPGVNQRTSRSSHPRAWLQISSRRLISSLSASSETMSLSRSVALALLAQTEGVDISTEIAPPKKHPLTIRRILPKAVELWRGVSSHMLSVLRSWTSVLWLNASPAGSRHIKHLRRRNRGAEDEP